MGGRATPDGAAVRTAILDAATEVFGDCGFRGATVEMIADRAGVDADVVATGISDLAPLLLATLTRRDDADAAGVSILDKPGGLQLLRELTSMMRTDERKCREARLHLRVIAEAIDPGHPAHGWALERYQWMRSLLAAALRRDQDAGLIRPQVDAAALATRVIAVMDGLQLQWLLDGDATDMFTEFSGYVDELIALISLPRG